MLFYGKGEYIPDDCKVYNLNSMKEGFPRFKFLLPPNKLGKFLDRDFDIAYFEYIFQNDYVFYEFFSIIYELYINNDVFIIVDSSMDWAENIAESLFKAIQQRYGYNSYRVNSEEDYLWIKNSSSYPQFNPQWGIYNLDIDKERYSILIESARLKAGGDIYC
jgi:hypothetical protein